MPSPDLAPISIIEKLSYLTPRNLYFILDDAVQNSILYFANDVGVGLGCGILATAFIFKLFFAPAMLLAVYSSFISNSPIIFFIFLHFSHFLNFPIKKSIEPQRNKNEANRT